MLYGIILIIVFSVICIVLWKYKNRNKYKLIELITFKESDIYAIKLRYKDKVFNLVVDTGCEITCIHKELIDKLGYEELKQTSIDTKGDVMTGGQDVYTAYYKDVVLSHKQMHFPTEICIVDLEDFEIEEVPISGYLGMNTLKKHNFILNIIEDQMQIKV